MTLYVYSGYYTGKFITCINLIDSDNKLDDVLLNMLPKGYLEVLNGHSFDFDSDVIQLTLSRILDIVLSMVVKTTVINLVYLSNKEPDSAINIIYDNISRDVNLSKVNVRSEIKNTKPFLTLKVINGM